MAAETQADRILAQFKFYDVNGDGIIDRSELQTILQGYDSSKWTTEKVDAILAAADLNKDQCISYDEFVAFVSNSGDDQAEFLKAAEKVPDAAIVSLVRSVSQVSEASGKGDLTPALEELANVPWEKKEPAIGLMLKLLRNIVNDPTNPKFRRLKRSNAKLQEVVFSVPGCAELLMASGFEPEGEELVLPEGVDVKWILDELDSFGKQELMDKMRAERDAKIAAAKAEAEKAKDLKGHIHGGSDDRKALLEKIEYDRQERVAREKLAAEGFREEVAIPAEKAGGGVTRFSDVGVDLNKPAG